MELSEQDRLLLNQVQQDFPLHPEPFKVLSDQLGMPEQEILERLQLFEQQNAISRFGAVFNHHQAGASTLAALAVPEEEIEQVAEFVNAFAEVNHNYEREHEFNLWFVVNAPDQQGVEQVLNKISAAYPYALLDLPMVKGYHIDLGFPLMVTDALAYELRKLLQEGLPLVEKPYQEIARQLAVSEQVVIDKIAELKQQGLIKRFGMVLRHHELGYSANCMVVWDIPDEQIEQVADKLASSSCVTLCYQRPRREKWPYNLFCMIHGKVREQVEGQLQEIIETHQLDYPHQLLFSSRRFKQRGARYV